MTRMTKAEALRVMNGLRLTAASENMRNAARVACAALKRSMKSTHAIKTSAIAKRKRNKED